MLGHFALLLIVVVHGMIRVGMSLHLLMILLSVTTDWQRRHIALGLTVNLRLAVAFKDVISKFSNV